LRLPHREQKNRLPRSGTVRSSAQADTSTMARCQHRWPWQDTSSRVMPNCRMLPSVIGSYAAWFCMSRIVLRAGDGPQVEMIACVQALDHAARRRAHAILSDVAHYIDGIGTDRQNRRACARPWPWRDRPRGNTVAPIEIDGELPPGVLARVRALPQVQRAFGAELDQFSSADTCA
jgi:hypothetical protein